MAHAPNTVEGMLERYNQGFLYESTPETKELVRKVPGVIRYHEFIEKERRN